MAYRDDRAALEQRADNLEQELRVARERARDADALGRDVARQQQEIDQLRARLADHEGPPRPTRLRARLVGGVALFALLGLVGGPVYFLFRAPAPASPLNAAPRPAPTLAPCEAYLSEIEACAARKPEFAPMKARIPEMRARFNDALTASPSGRDSTLSACRVSVDALRAVCK